MLFSLLRGTVIPATILFSLGLPQAYADSSAPSASLSAAYRVLNAHNLLTTKAPGKSVDWTPLQSPASKPPVESPAAVPEAPLAALVTVSDSNSRPWTFGSASSAASASNTYTTYAPSSTATGSTRSDGRDVLPKSGALWTAYQILISKGLLKSTAPATTGATRSVSTSPKVDRVVVDKSDRKLYLLKNGLRIREFPIALGGAPKGPKLQAGDLRTPEGVYTLDWRNSSSRFYKAIHISYPNAIDRVRAEEHGVDPGGMVMIHGEHYMPALRRIYRRVSSADWTEGCIALHNEYMDELWMTVADGTPIEIRP